MTAAPAWEPRNPAWAEAVRASFGRQAHLATLGAHIAHLAPGALDLAAPYDARFTQQNGFWHAGAVASLADSANGYAAFTLAPPDSDVLAVEFKINLLAPAVGETFRAEGRVVRPHAHRLHRRGVRPHGGVAHAHRDDAVDAHHPARGDIGTMRRPGLNPSGAAPAVPAGSG